MYLTGSRALNHQLDYQLNSKSDWDLVLEGENVQASPEIDIAPNDLPVLEVCQKYDSGKEVDTPVGPARLINPIGIMLMKRSHLHRPLNFAKHIRDYHLLKDKFKEKIDHDYFPLLSKLTKATKDKFGDRFPSLNKSKREFFDDYVTKVYEHDDIHRATCYYDEPIFERLKTDSDKVWCSKKKWDQLSHEDQVKCVREEAFVIAIERYLMFKKGYPARWAFNAALERICTTLTSGWFRDFAIDNWLEISDCEYDFVDKFLKAGFKFQWTQS